MNILIVEDDPTLADGLCRALSESGFDATKAGTLGYAKAAMINKGFDLLILDLGLPDGDGLELLQSIRARGYTMPVLILTARHSINDRVEGLKAGADDFLIKPFDLRELEARVQALLRRTAVGYKQVIQIGILTYDAFEHSFMLGGTPLYLSPREMDVLEALVLQPGRVISKDRIAQRLAISGEEVADNAIEVYIHRLRRRLEGSGLEIRTLRGLGYLLEERLDVNQPT
jgi:two-component system OmpR family response regulator